MLSLLWRGMGDEITSTFLLARTLAAVSLLAACKIEVAGLERGGEVGVALGRASPCLSRKVGE